MRTRNFSSIAATSVNSGINGNNTVEIRATLGVNKKENQTVFTFHGGKISNGKFGYFGEFRPMPLQYKLVQGVKSLQLNEDGTPKSSPIWVANVTEKQSNLSPQDTMLLEAAKANPEFAKFLPINIQDALNNSGLVYEEFDWQTFLGIVGHSSVKFTVSIPQSMYSIIEEIKETVNNKEQGQNYSLVLRFDADDMQLKKELSTEYNSELYRQDIKIVPTYIGIIEGVTAQREKTGLLNPVNISNALAKAKEVKATKVNNPYVSDEFLASQAAKVQERLASIGTGKKAHQPIVQEIYDAAKINSREDFAQAVRVLNAIAERGTNPVVTTDYVTHVVAKAESEFTPSSEQALQALFDD